VQVRAVGPDGRNPGQLGGLSFIQMQAEGAILAANSFYSSTMARFFIALAAGMSLLATPGAANAKSSLEGRWKNGRMEIMIRSCGRSLCGTVVKASAKQQSRAQRGSGTQLLGSRVIDNIRPAGAATYKADVYVADRDMNARGTIRQVSANRLNVRGCVFGFLCKTTNWDRIGQ
jgi:uncharacterized protein (DUF2147 family)